MEEEDAIKEIEELIHRETLAWNTKNVQLLLSIFHNDMVWPWPPTASDHDPLRWSIGFGMYNFERWSGEWQELFDTHNLIHNNRIIQKIQVSDHQDGGFAVVDIDTLWEHKSTKE